MGISTEGRLFGLALLLSTPVTAQTTVGDLERYFEASRRMLSGEAIESRLHYQSGFFAGYLEATRERLQAEGAPCLGGCRCRFDTAVEAALLNGIDANRPASAWLAEVLTTHEQPCP